MLLVISTLSQMNVLNNNQLLNLCVFGPDNSNRTRSDCGGVVNILTGQIIFPKRLFWRCLSGQKFFRKRELVNKSVKCIGG